MGVREDPQMLQSLCKERFGTDGNLCGIDVKF